MIKRNSDNVFAIAASNNVPKSSVSLYQTGVGGSGTRIPQPRAASVTKMTPTQDRNHNNKETNLVLSTYVEKWKSKYEEAERKYKNSLLQNEKARRDNEDLTRRHTALSDERDHLQTELRQRERDLNKLRQVSERLFNDYQRLRNQTDVGEGVIQKVLQQAGEWYKQNKQLKRRSTALFEALPNKNIDLDITDSLSDSESERKLTAQQASEIISLKEELSRRERVTKLLVEEAERVKSEAQSDSEKAKEYKKEASAANKRITVLTHQSALLLADLDPDERVLALMQEVERLKEEVEQRDIRHRAEVDDLQLKLTEKHEDIDIMLWEEKIRLAEEEARKATERAESLERKLAEIEPKPRSNIMSRISYFEKGANIEKKETAIEGVKETGIESVKEDEVLESVEEEKTAVPPTPSIPPPPPPPLFSPPPPPPVPPLSLSLSNIGVSPSNGTDMATMLASKQGTLKKAKVNAGGGAIDAIVDQIKGGKFHLKSTEQNFLEKKPKDDQPEAVKEMLAILGTLRKRRSISRPSFVASNVDKNTALYSDL